MNFKIEISSAVLSAIISATISWLTARQVAKIEAKNEIQKLKMQFEHDDQVRQDESQETKEKEILRAFQSMTCAVTEYRNKHDVNYMTSAQASIQAFIGIAGTSPEVEALLQIIRDSDPFDGPATPELDAALNKVLIEHRKKFSH